MRGVVGIAVVGFVVATLPHRAGAAEPTPAEVFETRIVPIFKSPNPSSCVPCHLAGVDLKDYILPDADRTFRSLRDQGLIDLAAPERSKIVALIDMGGDGARGRRCRPTPDAVAFHFALDSVPRYGP